MKILGQAGKLLTANSPAILTAIGAVGVIGTAVLTADATLKAAKIVEEQECYESRSLEPKERAELTWKLYIPPLVSGTATILAIVYANRISSKRVLGLAAALGVTERAYDEYAAKIRQKFGDAKETTARDEIAQQRVSENPPKTTIVVDGLDVLCMDAYSGRYFVSNMEALRKAQNDLNHAILQQHYRSLSDYYHLVGLPGISCSDLVGWDGDQQIELLFSAVLAPDGRPCISVGFRNMPKTNFDRFD